MTASPSQPRWCDLVARAPQVGFKETCPRSIKGAGNGFNGLFRALLGEPGFVATIA